MRWDVLAGYAASVRAVRLGQDPPPEPGVPEVGWDQVAAYRQRVSHLDARLAPGAFDQAAYGGLQDTQPRAALMALHARMADVGPSSWEDPSLAQIWLRWADYVVPRSAIGPFTLGAAPRDRRYRHALDEFADLVLDTLAGERRSRREVAAAFPDRPEAVTLMRCLGVTGKVHIRWDASSSEVVPATPADIDPEDARVQLARRFVHWSGPATVLQFAKWAGVSADDAKLTWAGMRDELAPVSVEGAGRWILGVHVPAIRAENPPPGSVRFLPGGGDPYLQLDRGTAVAEPPADLGHRYLAAGGSRSVLNGLTGRLLLDGKVVGSWGRAAASLRIALWTSLPAASVKRVLAEALTMRGPLGAEPRITWVE